MHSSKSVIRILTNFKNFQAKTKMLSASYCRYRLIFKSEARTSRSVMLHKNTWFVRLHDSESGKTGIGECALFEGLSSDDKPTYEARLSGACRALMEGRNPDLRDYPSIRFGVETALTDLANGGEMKPFPSSWSLGERAIAINGLVWMGSAEQMQERVAQKIDAGFKCVKLKIGGVDFDDEVAILRSIRSAFSANQIEIRLDANGAFAPSEALRKLDILASFDIHSIEQPIRQNQLKEMAEICRKSPIPIALDEELIGRNSTDEKKRMLEMVRPAYVILKPALCGGFSGADEWINVAETVGLGWWATSALESNIGLNAIAQWVSLKDTKMPQGLGTGALYVNNIESPIVQTGDSLRYNSEECWVIPEMQWMDVK